VLAAHRLASGCFLVKFGRRVVVSAVLPSPLDVWELTEIYQRHTKHRAAWVGRPLMSLGLHACLRLWSAKTSLVRFARFQEPWRRSLLLSMQQSAISSNGLASQPSHSRPPRVQREGEGTAPDSGQFETHQFNIGCRRAGKRPNWKASPAPASPRFTFPGFSRHLIWIANTPQVWILEQKPTGGCSRARRCSLGLSGSIATT
jgi:hypothetical protein